MKVLRIISLGVLGLVFLASLLADVVAPAPYSKQYREAPNAPPSRQFPLGTDELGRDRFSRLLYGSRVSLLLAPAAALLSTLGAAVIGGTAGYWGKWWERMAVTLTDLFLSLPWLFLLLTVRALLPLNVSPLASVVVTFSLLGLLGWASSARVVRAGARSLRSSDFVLQARAGGCLKRRIFFVQILPNLKPVLSAQFWISVPAFILAEANLGLLGLGVAEPLPSWGNLLRELENYSAVRSNPWLLAPLFLLVAVVSCFQILLSGEESFQ
ncbi:MAG TPA: ABC transporter permease [Terriglobia bacterium]|nr:ABC transporter permease [Terriglobia bacterium]